MTPQEEKARELVNKFWEFAESNYHECAQQWELSECAKQNAKQCAKIAVNEIIASIPTQPSTGELERVDAIMFWINVGQEIDKI